MPGPAPPSASYLLKIVDSSDEEDEEETSEDEEMLNPFNYFSSPVSQEDGPLAEEFSPTPAHPRSDSVVSATSSNSDAPPKKKKKKKNRNKNKKKKKTNQVITIDATDSEDSGRSVSFDCVTVHAFERCLGTDVVPCDGGWPLGLAEEAVWKETLTLDEYETAKQERLRIRAEATTLTLKSSDDYLETRQWDYKHKVKNPLFHLMLEEDRMELLLRESTPEGEDDAMSTTSSHHSHNTNSPSPTKRNSSGSTSKGMKKRDSKNNQSNGSNNTPGPASTTRNRSQSFSHQERYNETYTQVLVHHVRNELEELRFQRTGEGHIGCQCRKLDVYLLPPNAGKKAHHRRMKVLRVKEELRKRHLLPSETKTREELELLLHNAVEKEGCCSGQDCPCARNGIGCNADVCNCWYDSHQTKEGGKHDHSGVSVEDIQARCGNANGMYACDLDRIQLVRKRVLQKALTDKYGWVCPPVSPHTPLPPMVAV